jgi:hypothetical protein
VMRAQKLGVDREGIQIHAPSEGMAHANLDKIICQ